MVSTSTQLVVTWKRLKPADETLLPVQGPPLVPVFTFAKHLASSLLHPLDSTLLARTAPPPSSAATLPASAHARI